MTTKIVFILAAALFSGRPLLAQPTNIIRADIELFEAQTNVLLVRGFGPGGTVGFEGGSLAVRLKDSFSPESGKRMQGVVITFTEGERHERATVDYDEIEPLLKAMDYLHSASYDATGLPSFEASIRTRDGFRVIALGSHRQTSVQHFIQFDECARIALNSDQIVQLRGVIAQARTTLDELRPPK